MKKLLRKILPETFHAKMLLLTIATVCISTLCIAFIVEQQGIKLLMQEKENKLLFVAGVLEQELGAAFDLPPDPALPRSEAVGRLNALLSARAEALVSRMPGVGAGYYNRALDAIVVYAPASEHGRTVGTPIAADHPGRQVMASGERTVWQGAQVRGDIMNAMIPVVREGEVLGYVWANELVSDIDRQTMMMDKDIILVSLLCIASSVLLTLLISNRLQNDITIIKHGVQGLSSDLQRNIPPLKGEMNEIVDGVNQLAWALSEAKSMTEMILDSIIDSVITVNMNGEVTMMNPAAQKMTGLSLEEAVGRPYRSLFDHMDFYSPLLDTLSSGSDHVGVELDLPIGGKLFKVSSSASNLRNKNGEIIGAVVVFKDISEQKEMQHIAEQTQRLAAIGELMAGVAHEIRNPLTAIRGFVQCLNEDVSQGEKEEFISIILKEVDSINGVIQQLLDFSRQPKNFFSLSRLDELVGETLVLVKSSKNAAHVDFQTCFDEGLPELYLDRGLVKQVLLNLLLNAIQAIEDRGQVIISTGLSDSGRYQTVQIRDTGSGIDDSLGSKIFTPFFTTKPNGTGLGLAVAQKIVASHGGRITLENHPEGGAVATISLPVA
ncbi:two-component system sensor histidine kinase AtoS [Thauera sp.]|uniref:two-component system sensor histidine kinase AtoS n=1 Tax=Thauera sp. TaxID=1905334 RepID=UPI0039E51967